MISIIDYNAGNPGSIKNMLKKTGYYDVEITSHHDTILKSEKIILPGVGSFSYGMNQLHDLGLVDILNKKVIEEKVPILGICLGMQLTARGSEEGETLGLNWLNTDVRKFELSDYNLPIPHMGWNRLNIFRTNNLFDGIGKGNKFYFAHSFYFTKVKDEYIASKTEYGVNFISSIRKDNIYGVQFHPEKSHKWGLKLFENFLKL
jgi:imidazole glycerol-phosphate synthase subunit HisH